MTARLSSVAVRSEGEAGRAATALVCAYANCHAQMHAWADGWPFCREHLDEHRTDRGVPRRPRTVKEWEPTRRYGLKDRQAAAFADADSRAFGHVLTVHRRDDEWAVACATCPVWSGWHRRISLALDVALYRTGAA